MYIRFVTIKDEPDGEHHDFNIWYETDDVYADFHLFCIAIIRDLLSGKHRLNDYDETFEYDLDMDEEEKEILAKNLAYIYQKIYRDKISFQKSLDDLKNNI